METMFDAHGREWRVSRRNNVQCVPGGSKHWVEIRATHGYMGSGNALKWHAFYDPPADPKVLTDQIERDLAGV